MQVRDLSDLSQCFVNVCLLRWQFTAGTGCATRCDGDRAYSASNMPCFTRNLVLVHSFVNLASPSRESEVAYRRRACRTPC